MPIIVVKTNVSSESTKGDIHTLLTDIGHKHLRKPKDVIWVQVDNGCRLTQNATFDPAAVVTVECIGRLRPKVNLSMAKDIEECLKRTMGIPGDRVVIKFESVPALFATYNGQLHDTAIDYDEDLAA